MTVAAYDQNEGKMRIRISQKLLLYLIALRDNFTQFQLKVALNLRSKYSKRLYEMLSQHKEAGGFSISVEELKWRLELIEAEKQPGKYIHFNALKRRVLEVAQRELDKYADITFSYEAIKTGRTHTDLTFRIHPNKNIHMHGEVGIFMNFIKYD